MGQMLIEDTSFQISKISLSKLEHQVGSMCDKQTDSQMDTTVTVANKILAFNIWN